MHMWTMQKMGMRTFLFSLLLPLTILIIGILGLLMRPAFADPGLVTTIILTPSDVGSLSATQFTTLPTDNPTVFGFGMAGGLVQKVDFDFDPDGNPIVAPINLTDEYSSIGVFMNDIRVTTEVEGGAASPPNATTTVPENPDFQVFTFAVPVLEAGIINTTPDLELYEFFDENGNLLASVFDQGNPDIDIFIGGKVSSGSLIKTLRITNINYATELDELIFTPLAVIQVAIDIKPSSYPNCFNINGNGVIPVAILGSANLDVMDIKTDDTLAFNGLGVRLRGKKGPVCSIEDSNGDEFLDLVCHFEDDSSEWVEDSQESATLTGELVDDTPIEGTDSICIVQ